MMRGVISTKQSRASSKIIKDYLGNNNNLNKGTYRHRGRDKLSSISSCEAILLGSTNSEDVGFNLNPPSSFDSTKKEETGSVFQQVSKKNEAPDALATNVAGYEDYLPRPFGANTFGTIHETSTYANSDSYDLTTGVKLAVIFNHTKFDVDHLGRRNGTELDCQVIVETFGSLLGFVVEQHEDLTVLEIRREIHRIQDLPNLSCLALFILSHGHENGQLHACDQSYLFEREIVNRLLPSYCPALAGKPKLFFIQACQGQETDDGYFVRATNPYTSVDAASMRTYRVPNYADLLIFYSSYFGHFAYRTADSGSWFIQTLCDCLINSEPSEDLVSVLTRVSRCVALDKTSNVPHTRQLDDKKQIPMRQDTLIRRIYLKASIETVTSTATLDKPRVIPSSSLLSREKQSLLQIGEESDCCQCCKCVKRRKAEKKKFLESAQSRDNESCWKKCPWTNRSGAVLCNIL